MDFDRDFSFFCYETDLCFFENRPSLDDKRFSAIHWKQEIEEKEKKDGEREKEKKMSTKYWVS